jgi:pimeloyl-ACP methyl ester carboxylesterase
MNSHSIAKKLYVAINVIESKVARLSKYTIDINGLEVTYLSNVKTYSANIPVLVLLHGFSGDKYVWNRLAKYFTSDYQLLIPDLKGHGETPYNKNDVYSVPSQNIMLNSLLDELQIDKFSVVGNSMGGMMAAHMIEKAPERIDKCILIDPAGAKSQFIIESIDTGENPFNYCTEQDFFDFFKLLMAKPPFVPKFMLRALAREYIGKNEQHSRMFKQFFTLNDFFSSAYRFKSVNTMLIWGMNDQLLPIEDYQQWKEMLNGATQIYEDLGHVPMIEDAKRVAKDILIFLQH